HRDATNRIEIATVGIDREEAFRLRALLELIRDAHLRVNREAPRLEILVEPADTLRYAASGAKRDGILRLPQRALHIELPKGARVVIVCGKGGNGSDGFVVARWLKRYGARPSVLLACAPAEIGGDAGLKLEELRRSGIRPRRFEDDRATAAALTRAHLVVDAL